MKKLIMLLALFMVLYLLPGCAQRANLGGSRGSGSAYLPFIYDSYSRIIRELGPGGTYHLYYYNPYYDLYLPYPYYYSPYYGYPYSYYPYYNRPYYNVYPSGRDISRYPSKSDRPPRPGNPSPPPVVNPPPTPPPPPPPPSRPSLSSPQPPRKSHDDTEVIY